MWKGVSARFNNFEGISLDYLTWNTCCIYSEYTLNLNYENRKRSGTIRGLKIGEIETG